MIDTGYNFNSNTGIYNGYDCGSLESVDVEQVIVPCKTVMQLLIFPTEDALVNINEVGKWIFLPANMWTPISISVVKFAVKTVDSLANIYWQGWYL